MKRAVVVARVSTDDQAKDGFSLAAQVEAGRKYAEAHGFDVVLVAIDDGVSGAVPFRDRPAGARAWAMLHTGEANVLIVQNVDRLSRDIVDLLVTVRELLRLKVELHCLDLGRVESEYDIMLVIRGWQGSDERAKIRERSVRGKNQKAREGMVVAVGKPPYGYTYLRDERGRVVNFEIITEQAAVVRLIFQLYTTGDDKGGPYSLYEIAKRLSLAGIPAPSNENRKSSRHIWNANCIGRILKSTTYVGEWQYNACDSEQIVVKVPTLVELSVWEAAQAQRGCNQRKAKRNAKHDYLLTGIITCGCGRAMAGTTPRSYGKHHRYYFCNTNVRLAGLQERNCFEPHIRADELEAAVWDYFVTLLKEPESFEAKLREAQQLELETQSPRREELTSVIALIDEAEAEAERLGEALTKAKGIVAKTLEEKMIQLNARYEALEARRAELEVGLQRRLTDEAIAATLTFAQDAVLGLDFADHATKRRVLDLFDARVRVKDKRVFLTYAVQTTPIELRASLCAWRSSGTALL